MDLQTPLHLAVITQQHAVIVMLVRGGANANLPDRFGRTATHLAVESRDIGSLQALTHATNPRLDLEIRNFDGKAICRYRQCHFNTIYYMQC